MAGVAGFEPTNDGVRGTPKLPNIVQKALKNPSKTLDFDYLPHDLPHAKIIVQTI